MYNIEMRSSKLIIRNNAQKVMAKSGFGRRFHDLKYIEVGFLYIFLEFTINARAKLHNELDKH